MTSSVRVRIAPSPTGYFHVGNARTALFDWLFARQSNGTFVVRIEDTDQARYVADSLDDMLSSLMWLGLDIDEGPGIGGDYGPYFQSERTQLYREHVERLLESGHAYRCYCTAERLAEVRESRAAAGLKVGYDRHCRNLSDAEIAERESAGATSVVRLKAPLSGEVVLTDLLRGDITFDAGQLEDVVLLKSDGFPTYHLAVVVDDHAMDITHVLRADEWIPSSPIQVLLYAAFGWDEPLWVHVPLVLNPGGKGKLSKRGTAGPDGQPLVQMTQVREFRAAGYLPEAMFNYLALLGWAYSGDEDLFTREQALERFRLEDIKVAPAAWNQEKLDWMNGVYIRELSADELAARVRPFLLEAGLEPDEAELLAAVPLIQERMTMLSEALPLLGFLWQEVSVEPEDLVPKKLDAAGTSQVLRTTAARLEALSEWTLENVEAAIRGMAEELDLKPREAFQPIRVAVTGSRISPPLFETVHLLGRERAAERLARAESALKATAEAG